MRSTDSLVSASLQPESEALMRGRHGTDEERYRERMQLKWVDVMKAIALIWIFLNHAVERVFGFPYIANPFAGWPPLAERLAQLRPLDGYGIWDIPLTLLRYLGWTGDQGVQLFLILSGFGLTWGLLNRRGYASLHVLGFYRRRAKRVYPLWWGVHFLFAVSWLLVGWGLAVNEPAFYLSLVGIRVTPGVLYYFAPAWWFIGLLLQLYLVYPLLWEGLRRWGPLRLLLVSCAVAFLARAVGLLLFDTYVDAWQRGAVFVTRLPEFVLGVSLAAWLYTAPDRTGRWLHSPRTLLLALGSYLLGTALSLTLLGMAVAPFLLGLGVFILLYALLDGRERLGEHDQGLLTWVGRHSYALYLVHHPLILLLVPAGLMASGRRAVAGVVAAMLLTIVGAVALEWAVDGVQTILGRWRQNLGIMRTALRIAALGFTTGLVLLGGELMVQWRAPQEVFGWGERTSLEPHAAFGWRLKPSSETQLRWQSYDYLVVANSLGFPGPEYPEQKPPHTLRILTTGDAFTSAEGVDTDQSWPRLLETELAAKLPRHSVEVLNFAVTGYGPNQYAAVVQAFAPIYKPDLILIGFFVNEYEDVLWSDEQFRQSIGFDRPTQNSWYATASLSHLRQILRLRMVGPVVELLRNESSSYGYFLGNFAALERDRLASRDAGWQLTFDRLRQIKAVANTVGAEVALLMIPAPVQVCEPDEFAYYPRHADLSDSTQFDLERPQRLTRALADTLEVRYYDLRPALQSVAEGCPYQTYNMHWTGTGHRAVATYLAQSFVTDSVVHLSEEPR